MEWNYAQRHGLRDEVYHVSIPSGIEFYLVACFSPRLSPIVSIPNGMEFYAVVIVFFAAIKQGFNSQRDGILRRMVLIILNIRLLSFNSQRELKCETHISRIHRLSVEFYSIRN